MLINNQIKKENEKPRKSVRCPHSNKEVNMGRKFRYGQIWLVYLECLCKHPWRNKKFIANSNFFCLFPPNSLPAEVYSWLDWWDRLNSWVFIFFLIDIDSWGQFFCIAWQLNSCCHTRSDGTTDTCEREMANKSVAVRWYASWSCLAFAAGIFQSLTK